MKNNTKFLLIKEIILNFVPHYLLFLLYLLISKSSFRHLESDSPRPR